MTNYLSFKRLAFLVFISLLAILCSGCASAQRRASIAHSSPHNVFRFTRTLPRDLRRVAVLPISFQPGNWQADAGRVELAPVLVQELGKARQFEITVVSEEQLKQWTGRPDWQADEKFPADFFDVLRQKLDCDGVLFTHLRPYHGYEPLVIGWNLKLVETRNRFVVWCADEVFDAAEPKLASAARQYDDPGTCCFSSPDSGRILLSPRRFSQFSLASLFATLPER